MVIMNQLTVINSDVTEYTPEKIDLKIPIPNEAEPYSTLDLYAWNGQSWAWIPSQYLR